MLKFFKFMIPLVIFICVAAFFWKGLKLDPRALPATLINDHVPEFNVPELNNPSRQLTNEIFKGQVSLLTVWASWCHTCREEMPFLNEIAQSKIVKMYGLNYKDSPVSAANWLEKAGNPYQLIGADENGDTAINWGVYGIPESFVIDKNAVIRYKKVGSITKEDWERELKPIIEKLKNE